MNFKDVYENWINDKYFDDKTKLELLAIKDNNKEIEERFYKNLEFGTGGLRGIIGAGTNRINNYTISRATQGLANYILNQKNYIKEKGVAIGYDSRFKSEEFAEITALVLNANGIKTYLFDKLKPTPMVSFAIRELKCIAGIVITASHNSKEYNGYKVYGDDGGQIAPPKDSQIIEFVDKIDDFNKIKTILKSEAIKKGLFNIINNEIDEKYNNKVLEQIVNKDNIKKDLKIVYTPIHGTGNEPVRRALKSAGFENVYVVKEQEMPNPNFPTVEYPNPEDKKVFTLAFELAKKVDADVILGTDPDADRVGAVIKDDKGEYFVLNGNMMGTLLTNYILSSRQQNKTLSNKDTIISSIVSTDMTKKITSEYNVNYIDVLTGFKFIGQKIKEFEDDKSKNFIFGFEESYGLLKGTYVRDKDAIIATLLICELVSYYKKRGLTLYEGLQELYKKYGYYKNTIQSITLQGIKGNENINKIMESLRKEVKLNLKDTNIIEIIDYKNKTIRNLKTNEVTKTNLPISNVLYFAFEDKSWFCVRPSGTEPKIKIYFEVQKDSNNKAEKHLENLVNSVMKMIDNILKN